MDKKILKQLKSDYEQLEIRPSAGLWDQIDASLEKESVKSASSNHWWKYAAVILLFISVGTFIYYERNYNAEKTDYIVKKNLQKEVLKMENSSEIIPEKENPINKTQQEIVKENSNNVKKSDFQNLKPAKEVDQVQFSQPTQTNIVLHQPEKNPDTKKNIEIINQPAISDSKKINYITANDLLLGRELEKSREKSDLNTKKFGVIHIDKVIPKVGNVTVLGVTVYVDPN